MRTPKLHEAADGTLSWKVRFRTESERQTSETFYDEARANEFVAILNALGPTRARQWLEEQDDDEEHSLTALTVDDLFERWIEWKGERRKDGSLRRIRSQRTLADYRSQYKRKIGPTFGAKPAQLITAPEIQTWVDKLGADLEPKTVADYHALLHQVYKWASAPSRQIILLNPCTETELPKRIKKPPKGLHPQQWQILIAAAYDVDRDAADLLFFKASTGWRISECFGLMVKDVVDITDTEGGKVSVGMNRVMRRETGTGWVIVEDGKSSASQRDVLLVDDAAAMVLARCANKKPDDLVFTNRHGSRWLYPSFHQAYWTRATNPKHDKAPKRPRILERARERGFKEPATPHWLRHTQAGLMILAGESPAAIQRRLGHASIKTTYDVYGRMIEDVSINGLAAVNALLAPPKQLGGALEGPTVTSD